MPRSWNSSEVVRLNKNFIQQLSAMFSSHDSKRVELSNQAIYCTHRLLRWHVQVLCCRNLMILLIPLGKFYYRWNSDVTMLINFYFLIYKILLNAPPLPTLNAPRRKSVLQYILASNEQSRRHRISLGF